MSLWRFLRARGLTVPASNRASNRAASPASNRAANRAAALRLPPLMPLLLTLFLPLFLLGGCDSFANLRKPEATQTLLLAGSSSLKPLTDKLVAAFIRKHPGIIAVSDSGGSTAGVMALRRGVIDVAALSRDVRRTEDAKNIITVPLARNGIGFVVHSSNALHSLSPQQLRQLLTGRLAHWAEVGGGKEPVRVQTRHASSTTLRGVDDLLLHGDDLARSAVAHATPLELVLAVAADPAALGFVSLADMRAMPPEVQTQVKHLAVDGVPMTSATLLSGRYPLTRVFYYAFRDDSSPVARKFMDFTMSPEGQSIVRAEGMLTVR